MRKFALSVLLFLILGLLGSATVTAATVTVGSPLSGAFKKEAFDGPPGSSATVLNTALSPGRGVVSSPISGTVISWSVIEASGGPFRLRVLRPGLTGTYTGAGTSAPVTAAGAGIQTFSTSLPISAGELIGLDNSNPGDTIGLFEAPGSAYAYATPPVAEGAPSVVKQGNDPFEIGFNAVVLPPPTVSSLSAKGGSIKGGTKVTITGTDLSRATAVAFGGLPATSIEVASESQITAAAPPSKKAIKVPVSVTTPAGTVTAAAQFAYEACKVPSIKDKRLKKVRKRLKKSRCKLGKVKLLGDATKKSGEVAKQSPKPGKLLAPGSKVNVKLD